MHHHIPFKMCYPIVRYIWFTHTHYIYIHTITSHLYHTDVIIIHIYIYIPLHIMYIHMSYLIIHLSIYLLSRYIIIVYTYIIPSLIIYIIYIYIISRWLAGRAGWGRLHLHLRRAAAVPGRPATAVAQRPGLGAAAAEAAGDDGRVPAYLGGAMGAGWHVGWEKNDENNWVERQIRYKSVI